ncbi:hypothetical protein Tco_0261396 [Tanacetum coccineum]
MEENMRRGLCAPFVLLYVGGMRRRKVLRVYRFEEKIWKIKVKVEGMRRRKTTNILLNLLLFSGHQFRTHQGQLMETIVVCLDVISFQSQSLEFLFHPLDFSCWAVFSGHHSFHVALGDLIRH